MEQKLRRLKVRFAFLGRKVATLSPGVRLFVRSPVTRRWVIHENPREGVAHASSLHEASNISFTIHFTGRSTKFSLPIKLS